MFSKIIFVALFATVALAGLSGKVQPRYYGEEFVDRMGVPPPYKEQEPYSQCTFQLGQEWKGVYPGAETFPTQPSDVDVVFKVIGAQAMLESSKYAVLNIGFGLLERNLIIKTRDISSDPASYACQGKWVGEYHLTWSNDCQEVRFNVKEDYCGRRLIKYNELILKLQRPDAHCQIKSGEVWRGLYPDNRDLVGKMVSIYFGAGAYAREQSSAATINTRWTFPDGQNLKLLVRDDGGFCAYSNVICSPGDPAEYRVEWGEGCESLTLSKLNDVCRTRVERYDQLTLSKVPKATEQCQFVEGDTWHGTYPGDGERAGKSVLFKQGAGMRVTEQSVFGTTESLWFTTASGDLRTRDLQSRPGRLACHKNILSNYAVVWGSNCTEAMFSLIEDGCVGRSGNYDGLHIKKTQDTDPEPPMIINFNFDGLIPESRSCKAGYDTHP